MEVKLEIITTFSMEEGSEIVIELATEDGSLIATANLTLRDILDSSLEIIENPDEARELIEKIYGATRSFQDTLTARNKQIGGK